MVTRILRTFAAAAALAVCAFTASAPAAAEQTYHYTTALTQLYGSQIPYSGTLDLRFSKDGIVNGYYHPEGVISFIPVTGGRSGNEIWLDIGSQGRMHISGTIVDGSISGQAIQFGRSTPYSFTATPAKSEPY